MYFLPTDWSVNPPFYSPPFSKTPKLLQVLSRDTIFTVPFAYVLLLPLKFVQSLETELELCPYWKQLQPLSSAFSFYKMKIIPRTLWMRNESLASFLFLFFFSCFSFSVSTALLFIYLSKLSTCIYLISGPSWLANIICNPCLPSHQSECSKRAECFLLRCHVT